MSTRELIANEINKIPEPLLGELLDFELTGKSEGDGSDGNQEVITVYKYYIIKHML